MWTEAVFAIKCTARGEWVRSLAAWKTAGVERRRKREDSNDEDEAGRGGLAGLAGPLAHLQPTVGKPSLLN